jgi:hypothetical protein
MRKPLVALTVFSCLGLAACADGPTQTFTPAPPGAVNSNDGMNPGTSDTAPAGFTTQGGGQNKQVICNAAKEAAVWKQMVQAPIVPPTVGGQLDMAGLDSTGKIETWTGITIEQAEQINCQSTNDGDAFGDGNQDNYWGDNGEVLAEYLVSNHLIQTLTFSPGYTGTMNFTSRDGKDQFIMPVGTLPTKNAAPYYFDWDTPAFNTSTLFDTEINELYDALTATYAPALPHDPNCQGSGACIVTPFGDAAGMYFPALGVFLVVASYTQGQPTASTVVQFTLYGAKTLPYSLANPVLKLDAVGGVGVAGILGKNTTPCTMQMGLTFGTFLAQCVNVTQNSAADMLQYNKMVGALSHDDESWTFNVQGVDLNFRDQSLGAQDVVLDNTVPGPNDISVDFRIDQSTLGVISNDFTGNDGSKAQDLHGSGLVYLEYARNVQDALNGYNAAAGVAQHPLGDPKCLYPAVDVNDPSKPFPPGCTGFEGFVTAAPVTGTAYPSNALGHDAALAIDGQLTLGLKPGHPQGVFCLDANGDPTTGYTQCASPAGGSGDLFTASFNRVVQVFGKSNVANMPPDVQDQRFFSKQYVNALIKYNMAATSTGSETENTVHSQTVLANDLFFDSQGDGQFETAEYVDRRFANATNPPIDFQVTADVKHGIFNDFEYQKQLYRGETAIYSAVLESQSDGLGQEESALLTNVFGSPVIAAGWTGSADGMYDSYTCATGGWSATAPAINQTVVDDCAVQGVAQLVPLDADGVTPLLLNYKGAFIESESAFTLGPTPIKVTQTFDSIQQAMVSIPLYSDPYNWGTDGMGNLVNGSTPLQPLSILIPWAPKQPGIGFPIPLTGTLNKFVETSQLDFSGVTISANVDYDVVIDPTTGMAKTDGSLQIDAVETTDFLGQVFPCQDPATGDLLGVRMYDTVSGIQSWFAAHPGAYAACGMITTYSPYDNFADYVTSVTNGVRLDITQGGGFGRVVDVTLFTPGQ